MEAQGAKSIGESAILLGGEQTRTGGANRAGGWNETIEAPFFGLQVNHY